MKMCRHCQIKKANRPRQLCWTCWNAPGVRALYPATAKCAVWSNHPPKSNNAPLPEPTCEPVGSHAKMIILAGRAERGEQLFHPQDNQECGGVLHPFVGRPRGHGEPTTLEEKA